MVTGTPSRPPFEEDGVAARLRAGFHALVAARREVDSLRGEEGNLRPLAPPRRFTTSTACHIRLPVQALQRRLPHLNLAQHLAIGVWVALGLSDCSRSALSQFFPLQTAKELERPRHQRQKLAWTKMPRPMPPSRHSAKGLLPPLRRRLLLVGELKSEATDEESYELPATTYSHQRCRALLASEQGSQSNRH